MHEIDRGAHFPRHFYNCPHCVPQGVQLKIKDISPNLSVQVHTHYFLTKVLVLSKDYIE